MKLQAAIDRVTLEQAKDLACQLDPIVDIIEMGTSLIKDYGFYALNKEALGLQHAELLLDAKTIDEGQYEFEKGFENIPPITKPTAAGTHENEPMVSDACSNDGKSSDHTDAAIITPAAKPINKQ